MNRNRRHKIDGEVVVSGGQVTARGSRRYLVVSDDEVGVNGGTHVEMFPHQLCSKTKIDRAVHFIVHKHYRCVHSIFSEQCSTWRSSP